MFVWLFSVEIVVLTIYHSNSTRIEDTESLQSISNKWDLVLQLTFVKIEWLSWRFAANTKE